MRTVVSGEAWVLKREERFDDVCKGRHDVGAGWVGLCQTQWVPHTDPLCGLPQSSTIF